MNTKNQTKPGRQSSLKKIAHHEDHEDHEEKTMYSPMAMVPILLINIRHHAASREIFVIFVVQ